MYRMSRDDRTRKPPQPPERFTKVDDELVALGLPPRLVMLYGKLAYHAFKDGKCFVRHEKLAEEIGLHGKYRDRQVRNLLNQLRHLRLISWRRRRYCNDFDVHDPDRNWISGQTGTGFPLSDRKRISDRKEVKSLKEVPKRRTPTPTPPPSSCAPDGARVGESAVAKIPQSADGYRPEWFEQWWAIYWRKVAKKAAEKAFRAHVKTGERFQQVMIATRAQTPMMLKRDPEKRPHGATWINGERWNDEPSTPARKGPSKSPTVDELAQSIADFRRTR